MRHPSRRSTVVTIACLALLASCSYPPQPPGLLVSTAPPGASCVLTRLGQPIATADPTPAITRVEAEDGPITVSCRRHGFADASVPLVPTQSAPPGLVTGYPAVYPEEIDIALVPKPPGAPR